MTFRMTDDFAETVSDSLGKAYETLKNIAVDPKRKSPTGEEIMSAAMVKITSEIMKENIGNDKPVKKETVKTDAIKSV